MNLDRYFLWKMYEMLNVVLKFVVVNLFESIIFFFTDYDIFFLLIQLLLFNVDKIKSFENYLMNFCSWVIKIMLPCKL